MNRKGILQFIKNCVEKSDYNKEISNNPTIVKIIKKLRTDLHGHYAFVDIEKSGKRCHHRLRFYLLYMDENNLSFEEIANETYIDVDTLKYYNRLYNKTALQFVIDESNIDPNYAFLLNAYYKSGL